MNDPDTMPGDTWRATIRPAAVLTVGFTALAVAYTVAVAGFARLVGAPPTDELVLDAARAAAWAGPEWFHGRPAAAVGGVSGGSNLGPTNPALAAAVGARVAAVGGDHPAHRGPIPVDLVTVSASGLDPHLSPGAALLQVARVATTNGLPEGDVRGIVERATEPRVLGVFGQPRVNVVRLNAALAALRSGKPPTGSPAGP